jgi:hypothetical protein
MDRAEVAKHWKGVRRDLLRALDMLTDEQLAFAPWDGLWSLGKVARHIAEAEEAWFRYAVTRELEEWPEFRDDGHGSVASVKALLTEVHDRTEAFLATLGHGDLANSDADFAGAEAGVETPWGEKRRWIGSYHTCWSTRSTTAVRSSSCWGCWAWALPTSEALSQERATAHPTQKACLLSGPDCAAI